LKYWCINGKHGQGNRSNQIDADKLAKNTPNAPKFIWQNCLPKPKSLKFDEKRFHWASVAAIVAKSGFLVIKDKEYVTVGKGGGK
jgi:hypothetical protein